MSAVFQVEECFRRVYQDGPRRRRECRSAGDLGLDGLGERRPGTLANLGQHLLARQGGTIRLSVVGSFLAGYSSAS